jgi:hypothetical protein
VSILLASCERKAIDTVVLTSTLLIVTRNLYQVSYKVESCATDKERQWSVSDVLM